ncbi:MAG: conjugal transfer protein [Lachnospira sp.]|nr:conjugal transfer protein [Lachnospira sp.]
MKWLRCLICSNKIRIKIRNETLFENFLLFCLKCKHKILIEVRNLQITDIKEPDTFDAKLKKRYLFHDVGRIECCSAFEVGL